MAVKFTVSDGHPVLDEVNLQHAILQPTFSPAKGEGMIPKQLRDNLVESSEALLKLLASDPRTPEEWLLVHGVCETLKNQIWDIRLRVKPPLFSELQCKDCGQRFKNFGQTVTKQPLTEVICEKCHSKGTD